MRAPKQIEIASVRYKILVDAIAHNRTQVEEQQRLNGSTNHQKLEITLDPELASQALRRTLVHEIGHCLWDAAGLASQFSSEQEETIIRALEAPLYDFLVRNPKCLAFLIEKGETCR